MMVGNDWECDTCGNDNFSWRKSCKRCNKPKSKALKEAEQKAQAGWLLEGVEDSSATRIFIKAGLSRSRPIQSIHSFVVRFAHQFAHGLKRRST